MKNTVIFMFTVAFIAVLVLAGFGQSQSKDEKSIRAVALGFEKAWNRHDMDAMFASFTDDAEWVNIVGMHWVGLADVKRAHQAVHSTMFKNTELKIETLTVRKISNDTAVALLDLAMGDFTTPSGQVTKDSKDRLSLIMVKKKGRWLITHGHNTVIDSKAARSNPISSDTPEKMKQ
jgi:uncharacterized protein (TIGR02246 family)